MAQPVEFMISKTLLEEVKTDPELKMGFDAEFIIEDINDLLGLKPLGFDIIQNNQTIRLVSPITNIRESLSSLYRLGEAISEFEQTRLRIDLSDTRLSEKSSVSIQGMLKHLPMQRHITIDTTFLPRVGIAVNGSYGHRFDDLAKLAIRAAGILRTADQPEIQTNPVPRVWAFLHPILTPAARHAINQIMKGTHADHLPYLVLGIIRSAIENKSADHRTKHGILMLINDVLKMKPVDLLKALKNPAMMTKTGVIGRDPAMIPALTNYVKWLSQPAGKAPLMHSVSPAPEPAKKKKKMQEGGSQVPELSEYEKRRLKEKEERIKAEEREQQLRRKLLSEQNKRPRKTPVRWISE